METCISIVAAKHLQTKGNSKDYHVSAMDLYVLFDFGQYQIYFLSFYEMNPDCYFDIYFQVNYYLTPIECS